MAGDEKFYTEDYEIEKLKAEIAQEQQMKYVQLCVTLTEYLLYSLGLLDGHMIFYAYNKTNTERKRNYPCPISFQCQLSGLTVLTLFLNLTTP